jgi:hypothetical protein
MATITLRDTKGSPLTHQELDDNFSNLNSAKLENISEDTTPQLGGSLDVNGQSIISVDNGDITITPNGTGDIVLDGQNWPQAAPASDDEYLTSTAAGQLSWTDSVKAKTIYENVKNVSGGSLAKGTPVTQNGVVGNTITVIAARADDTDKLAIGVLDETLADEAEGRMTVLGEIKGVNTTAFSTGDKVYLGATGGYTNTPPTGNTVARQFLGVVNRVDASNGSGFITGTTVEDSVKWTGSEFQLWNGTSWSALASGGGDLVDDTTPQLGGDLDVNGFDIVGSQINLSPTGTGIVNITGTVNLGSNLAVLGVSTFDGNVTFANTSLVTVRGAIGMAGNTSVTGEATFGNTTLFNGNVTVANTSTLTINAPTTFSDTVTMSNTVTLSGPAIFNANVTVANTATVNIGATINTNNIATFNSGKVNITNLTFTETLYDLGTTGGTIAPNVTNGNVQKITLNSALTINAFSSPVAGQSLTLIIYGGTAYTSITSTMKFAGGVKTLTGTAGCIDILSVYYDGTNYFASLGKGFA